MTLELYIEYCLAKPGVEVSYPFKGECAWFKVGGKMFSLVNAAEMKMDGKSVPPFHFANLKCEPEKALALRESHAAIKPGWHQNKDHWNSLYMDGSLPDNLIKELIDHAYHIVASKLSKKVKAEIGIE
ncbi:MAG: MmcQ/YjbR family DNA-binding protein [Bacteroidota bacterium]